MAPSLYYRTAVVYQSKNNSILFEAKVCWSVSLRSSKSRKYCTGRLLFSVWFPESSLNVCTFVNCKMVNRIQITSCNASVASIIIFRRCFVQLVSLSTEYLKRLFIILSLLFILLRVFQVLRETFQQVLENSIEVFIVATSKLIKIGGELNKSKNSLQSILKKMVSKLDLDS